MDNGNDLKRPFGSDIVSFSFIEAGSSRNHVSAESETQYRNVAEDFLFWCVKRPSEERPERFEYGK